MAETLSGMDQGDEFGIVRFQEKGWQEPCESRGSRTDLLWGRGSEIPLSYLTTDFGRLLKV
jgi:hypothetical protein